MQCPEATETINKDLLIGSYLCAGDRWRRFSFQIERLTLGPCAEDPDPCPVNSDRTPYGSISSAVIRALPPKEQHPVAIAHYIQQASGWDGETRTRFLKEFIPHPTAAEAKLMETYENSDSKLPTRLPVCLDEFPSRIWMRAGGKGSPQRLAAWAMCAYVAAINLLPPRDDLNKGKGSPAWDATRHPSSCLPASLDLIGLTPPGHADLKQQIMQNLHDACAEERMTMNVLRYNMVAMEAWIFPGEPRGEDALVRIIDMAKDAMTDDLTHGGKANKRHLRRLGSLLARHGLRRLARQCARVAGVSAWRAGWHHQVTSRLNHAATLWLVGRRKDDSKGYGEWQEDPTLACSAMAIPLWLRDGKIRLREMTELMSKADECPWVFPRMAHVFQWHLAIAGDLESLHEVEAEHEEFSLRLSETL